MTTEKHDDELKDIFFSAVESGNINLIDQLLPEVTPQLKYHEWGDILRITIFNDRIEQLQFLIEKCGADINAYDSKEVPAFFYAVRHGSLPMLTYLMGTGLVNLDRTNDYGSHVLSFANCRYNMHLDNLRYMVEECKADVDAGPFTALDFAAATRNLPVVRYLVEECHAKIKNGEDGKPSLLHLIINAKPHLEIVKYLVETAGANPHAVSKDGSTVLHEAFNQPFSPLPSPDIIKYLVEDCHVDPMLKDKRGNTAVFFACYRATPETIRTLCSRPGLDANARNDRGEVLLNAACDRTLDYELLRFLVEECGADPNAIGANDLPVNRTVPMEAKKFFDTLTVGKRLRA